LCNKNLRFVVTRHSTREWALSLRYQSLLWLVIGRREPRAGAGGAGAQPDIHSLDSDPTQTPLDSQT